MRLELARWLKRARGRIAQRGHHAKLSDFWYRRRIRQVLALTSEEKAARGVKRTVRLVSTIRGLWQMTIEQTPGGRCQWGGTLFVASGPGDRYLVLNTSRGVSDFDWVVRACRSRSGAGWGMHLEPPEYVRAMRYDDAAEHQGLARFYTSCPELLAQGGIYRAGPPYVPYHCGRSWDFLDRAECPRKRTAVTVITSDVNVLPGHALRMNFLRQLDQSTLECASWGRGPGLQGLRQHRGYAFSKWGAYAPSRYSIVVENTVSPFYWSEKIADALLAYTFPFYHGSPNLGQYLPEGAFQRIDVADPSCLEKIEKGMGENLFERRLKLIVEARRKILDRENLYAFIDREMSATDQTQAEVPA